jgi:hypothetical protein
MTLEPKVETHWEGRGGLCAGSAEAMARLGEGLASLEAWLHPLLHADACSG